MHVNLILGLLVLLALGWLFRLYRGSRAQKLTPADLLREEIRRRKAALRESRTAAQRLHKLKEERLRPLEEGLRGMLEALPDDDAARVSLSDEGHRLLLVLPSGAPEAGAGASDNLVLEWDLRNFDLEAFSDPAGEKYLSGEYAACLPDGVLFREKDVYAFLRALSRLMAERLVL